MVVVLPLLSASVSVMLPVADVDVAVVSVTDAVIDTARPKTTGDAGLMLTATELRKSNLRAPTLIPNSGRNGGSGSERA
jgi:hypothetical protein